MTDSTLAGSKNSGMINHYWSVRYVSYLHCHTAVSMNYFEESHGFTLLWKSRLCLSSVCLFQYLEDGMFSQLKRQFGVDFELLQSLEFLKSFCPVSLQLFFPGYSIGCVVLHYCLAFFSESWGSVLLFTSPSRPDCCCCCRFFSMLKFCLEIIKNCILSRALCRNQRNNKSNAFVALFANDNLNFVNVRGRCNVIRDTM